MSKKVSKRELSTILGWFALFVLIVSVIVVSFVGLWEPDLYPIERAAYLLGSGPAPIVDKGKVSSLETEAGIEDPQALPNATWEVNVAYRLSACDNRPGLKKVYVRALDEKGEGLGGVKVRFGYAGGVGIAYDHPDIWGLTDERGFLEWDSLGVPTIYSLFMGDEAAPLVANMRADGGNEYCQPGTVDPWSPRNWRPINRPGIYSFRVEVQRIGEEIP